MSVHWGEQINIAHIEACSHIYGPGERFVIWVQGCSLACSGCWNQQMWSFEAHTLIHREKLLQQIIEAEGINGVTILGGEPLQQYDNIRWLLHNIRRSTEHSILLYTGYSVSELQQKLQYDELCTYCDILITGRYIEALRDTTQQWRGSSNQDVIYPQQSRLKQKPTALNEVEIHIDEWGKVTILGYPQDPSAFFEEQ